MRYRQIRLFLRVAEEPHLTRVAEREGMSPSGVSRAIRELERELGTTLFVRDGTGVRLTPDGSAAVEHARSVLAAFAELERVVRDEAAEQPPVRLGTAFSLPPAFAELGVRVLEQHYAPARGVIVKAGSSAEVMDWTLGGELDLAIAYLAQAARPLRSLTLLREERAIVMRADDELARHGRLRWDDLRGRRMLVAARHLNPQAVDVVHGLLARSGAYVREIPDADVGRAAALVLQDGNLFLVTVPRHGGRNSVFLDPAFALVPFDAEEAAFPLALVWRQDSALDTLAPGLLARLVQEFATL